jgi:adenylate cyclase
MNLRRLVSFGELSRENVRAGALWGLCVAIFGAVILVFPRLFIGQFLVHKSYDLPFIFRDYILDESITITNVVIAYMDEDSHEQLQQPYLAGWDRRIHAAFLRRMHADGAKAVVFDIVFNDRREGDREFAAALKEMKNVILAADNAPQTQSSVGQQYIIATDELLEGLISRDIESQIDDMSALKARVGIDEVVQDPDFAVRVQRAFHINDDFYPLSWVAASLLKAPVTQHPDGWKNVFWLNYYGPPKEPIPHVSYFRAFDTNHLQPGFFKDKVVFVGSSLLTGVSGQRKDAYKSAYPLKFKRDAKHGRYDNTAQIPGVEVQATMFLNLLRGDWFARAENTQQYYGVVIGGFLASLTLMLVRPARAVIFGVALCGGIVAFGAYSAIYRYYWFAWMIPVVQVILATLGSVAYNSYRLHMHRKILQHSISMYVSPAVAAEVLRKPDMMRPGARKELLSIMFTDIADFTRLSDGMDSETLAHFMNVYFEAGVNRCIHPTQGTVVKFIGDAIFSIWNAPIPRENHRELACRAAILLRDETTDFLFSNPDQKVRTRIGLHTGTASVGNFGSSNRVDYTALGEHINLTARMEGLNKHLGTRILATAEIIEPVQKQFTTRFLGAFQLKGFAKAVDVYELIGSRDFDEATRPWRAGFASGLETFRARNFDAATLHFKQVLQMNPKDGPSKFYLGQIHELRENPPPENWKGEVELKEK